MSDEWGPWIEHDGSGCPVPKGTWVRVRMQNGNVHEGRALMTRIIGGEGCDPDACWKWQPGFIRIVAYRVRKPRALIQLREMIKNLPAPSREGVDA